MCVLSIKVPIRKKSGNLFYDPRNCLIERPDTMCIYLIIDLSFGSLMTCHMIIRNPFSISAYFLWIIETLSLICQRAVKPHGFTLFIYCLFIEHVWLYHILSFNTTWMYIMFIKIQMFLYVKMIFLPFLLVCSVLVYERYVNGNIGPLRLMAWLNTFPTTMHTNNGIK